MSKTGIVFTTLGGLVLAVGLAVGGWLGGWWLNTSASRNG